MAYYPNFYNPYQMPTQGPVSAFQHQTANNPSVGFACRPVASKTEAEAFQIPFDGSTTYFVDTSNGKLYAKTFDFNTGSAPIVTFVREQAVAVQYATLDDLNALKMELMGRFNHDANE